MSVATGPSAASTASLVLRYAPTIRLTNADAGRSYTVSVGETIVVVLTPPPAWSPNLALGSPLLGLASPASLELRNDSLSAQRDLVLAYAAVRPGRDVVGATYPCTGIAPPDQCTSAVWFASITVSSGTTATPSTIPPTTTTIPPCTPACIGATLSARGGREGGGFLGEAQGAVFLTNIGTTACSLSDNPSVALLQSDGSQLDTEAAPPTNPALPPVLLQPMRSATLIVYWSNWCGSAPGALQIRITLWGNRGALTGPFDGPPNYAFVPACRDSSQPSTLSVVHAYYLGKI